MSAEATIIILLLTLIVGFFLGWILGKWRSKKQLVKIDQVINTPETIIRIQKFRGEQEQSTTEREDRDNERKRNIFGGKRKSGGDNGTGRTDGEQSEIAKRIGWPSDTEADGGSSELQDSDADQVGEDEFRDGEPDKSSEEDWPSFE